MTPSLGFEYEHYDSASRDEPAARWPSFAETIAAPTYHSLYRIGGNTLLVRLQGRAAPERATATLHTITARLNDQASIENLETIAPVSRSFTYAKDLTIDLDPCTVGFREIHTI